MTGAELLTIRTGLGMARGEFLKAIGLLPPPGTYTHPNEKRNEKGRLRKWEMSSVVPEDIAERANELWLRRGGCGS